MINTNQPHLVDKPLSSSVHPLPVLWRKNIVLALNNLAAKIPQTVETLLAASYKDRPPWSQLLQQLEYGLAISASLKVDKLDTALDRKILSACHTLGWNLLLVLDLLFLLLLMMEHMALQVIHRLRSVHEVLWPDNLPIVVVLDLLLMARIHRITRLVGLEESRLLLDGVWLHHDVMLHKLRLVPSLGEDNFHLVFRVALFIK